MPKTVGEVAQVIEGTLNKATKEITTSLQASSEEEIIPDKDYYLFKNKFWDKFFQKLLAQLISVKVWGLAILTVLIFMGLITGSEFIIGFSLVIGAKGGKDIVMKWVEAKGAEADRGLRRPNDDIIDRV